jgi:hypothetical protein
MILELQIAATQFLASFRELLKTIRICVPEDIVIPIDQIYKLDHYVFLDSASLTAGDQNNPIPQTVKLRSGSGQISVVPMRVKQDVKLFLAHESDIIIAADPAFSRAALRLELDPPSDTAVADWLSFFQGGIPDRLLGSQWGIFIDQSIIVQAAVKQVADGLANADPTQFVRSSGVGATWNVNLVSISFSGTVPNINCGLYHVDVGVDVTAAVSFHLTSPNQLGMQTYVDWSTNPWQVFECELGAILSATLVGALFGGIIGGGSSGPSSERSPGSPLC